MREVSTQFLIMSSRVFQRTIQEIATQKSHYKENDNALIALQQGQYCRERSCDFDSNTLISLFKIYFFGSIERQFFWVLSWSCFEIECK